MIAKCSAPIEPVSEPTKVQSAIVSASIVIIVSSGRPPPTRQAIPTSIAPAPIATPATRWPAASAPPAPMHCACTM
jgi:hypothetical protein